jgi:hypothetical protein
MVLSWLGVAFAEMATAYCYVKLEWQLYFEAFDTF